jgi:hypothetical protein
MVVGLHDRHSAQVANGRFEVAIKALGASAEIR